MLLHEKILVFKIKATVVIVMIHLGSSANRPFNLNVTINGTIVPMELDTGAAVSIMSVNTQKKYFPNIKLNKSNVIRRTYTSEKMLVVGEMSVEVYYNKQVKTLKLYVVDREGLSLFERDWLQHIHLDWKQLDLTTAEINELCVNSILERYCDVF